MPTDEEIEIKLAEAELLAALNALREIQGLPAFDQLPEPPFCSFCGSPREAVGPLVEGNDAYICLQCAAEARDTLLRER